MTISLELDLLYRMLRLREIEESIAHRYSEQKMRCPVHLSTGQEAVSAAVGRVLREDDYAVSGHRAHTHYLGKGGDLKRMLAEIYGKATGCCQGKGGSMHLIDESVGFKGSTAIVGGTIPVGVGLAHALKLQKTDRIACVFHGDGAVEEGVFFESVNFAVLKKLPVLFLCENNFYSVYSPLSVRQPPDRKIADMVRGMGLAASQHDGNDVMAVHRITTEAVHSIRSGQGPIFLEFLTYRWREHCGPNYDDDLGYRPLGELDTWKKRDPIEIFERKLSSSGVLTEKLHSNMLSQIRSEVAEAFAFAIDSPYPEASESYTHVFAEELDQ